MSPCMLTAHNDHGNTIQAYSVTVMTDVIALEAGQSSQGTFEPITPDTKLHAAWDAAPQSYLGTLIHVLSTED